MAQLSMKLLAIPSFHFYVNTDNAKKLQGRGIQPSSLYRRRTRLFWER